MQVRLGLVQKPDEFGPPGGGNLKGVEFEMEKFEWYRD